MVVLCIGEVQHQVRSLADLDIALDRAIGADSTPQLVSLRTGRAMLNLGVGREDRSVALHLTPTGQPMGARSRNPFAASTDEELTFAKSGHSYSFYPEAGIRPAEARQAAREFVETPGIQPPSLLWIAEPGSRTD